MDRDLAIEMATASRYLLVALAEIQNMVDRNAAGEPLRDLLQHAREMVEIITTGIRRMGDDVEAPRAAAMAEALMTRLEALERDIAVAPLH